MVSQKTIKYRITLFSLKYHNVFVSKLTERYCQCLGSLSAKHSLEILDMYCRPNQYIIADSLAKNDSGSPFKQVVPFKKRCGSMNPYMMHPNDKCYCDDSSVNSKEGPVNVMKGICLHEI